MRQRNRRIHFSRSGFFKACFETFFRNHISLAIHCNDGNWHQLFFYNRSNSCKIHALPIFNFLVYRFYGNIDYLENNSQPNFNSSPKTGVISHRGGGYLTKFNTGWLRPEVQPLTFYIPFWQKRYPFHIPTLGSFVLISM